MIDYSPKRKVAFLFVGVIGVFLIVLGLVTLMYYYTRPPGVDQTRIAERKKNLADLRAQTQDELNHYGWIDPTKGIVRLPVARSMELTVRYAQNPMEARSNRVARLEKALAPAPNPYE